MWLALYAILYIHALSEVQIFMVTWVRMQQNWDAKGTSIFRSEKLIVGDEWQPISVTSLCLKNPDTF